MKSIKKTLGIFHLFVPALKIFAISFSLIFILLIIGLFFSPQPFYLQGFTTLADVQHYAASINELTPLESENAVKPDFTNYYKRFSPSIIKTIKNKLGGLFEKLHLKKQPAFTASFFKTILDDVNKKRDQKGFKNPNIVRVTATSQSKFIIFGDMQAAFHSLVRNVAKLKELGILSDDLKIVLPDSYIIFLGDVPSRSPFSMETLGLVLRLMQQNPDHVLYTKGSHESDGYWQEHTLKTELKIRAVGLTKDATPLEPEVTKFFDSLSTIIFLAAPSHDNNAFIRFSRLNRTECPDKHFTKFLMTPSKDPIAVLSWQGNTLPVPDISAQEINVKAILRVEKKRETYQPSEGLRTLAPEMGVTTWTLLSAPTLAVERGFKFYNDTFAIIQAAGQIEQWKVTLFYQDRRKKDGYKTIPYFLTSGRDTPAPQSAPVPAPAALAQSTTLAASTPTPTQAQPPVLAPPAIAQSTVPQSAPVPAVQVATPAAVQQPAVPVVTSIPVATPVPAATAPVQPLMPASTPTPVQQPVAVPVVQGQPAQAALGAQPISQPALVQVQPASQVEMQPISTPAVQPAIPAQTVAETSSQ